MPRLQLESPTDVLDLDAQLHTGLGVQVHSGVTGLGLAPVFTQWHEGAGEGATYRGKRALPRDVDLPISIKGRDRVHLKELLRRLILMLDQQCTLRLIEEGGASWFTRVHRVGGGDYTYGVDTVGETELDLVLTVRAGDPYWTAEDPIVALMSKADPIGLLPELSKLKLAPSQVMGVVKFDNSGDAPAYPTWVARGPGNGFLAVSPSGEVLQWEGVLLAGESITIDTKRGTVIDQDGVNRYSELAPAPRMWRVPPGSSTAVASLGDPGEGSQIVCSWRPRRGMVI